MRSIISIHKKMLHHIMLRALCAHTRRSRQGALTRLAPPSRWTPRDAAPRVWRRCGITCGCRLWPFLGGEQKQRHAVCGTTALERVAGCTCGVALLLLAGRVDERGGRAPLLRPLCLLARGAAVAWVWGAAASAHEHFVARGMVARGAQLLQLCAAQCRAKWPYTAMAALHRLLQGCSASV